MVAKGESMGPRGIRAGVISLAIALALPCVHAQESPRFVMDRASMSVVSGAATSARFSTVTVATQSAVSGSASHCNRGFHSGVGFWSFTGATRVPIVLHVDVERTDSTRVQLEWSGADEQFLLFRSNRPDNVTDPANLILQTTSCSHTQAEFDDPGIVFYKAQKSP